MEIKIIGFDKKEKNKGLPICPNCHEKTFSFPVAAEVEERKGILGNIFPRVVTYTEYHCEKCGCIWQER